MMNVKALIFLIPAVLVSKVLAQSGPYGQCGGNGWNGATTCTTGYVCQKINDWFSQCVPGTAPPVTSLPPVTTPPPVTTAPPVTTVPPPVTTTPVPAGGPNYWFSFGDSYTSTGFNPSGSAPGPNNVLGNPNYPGSTMTGGENWVGYVTTKYNNSRIYTWNYAQAGATIDQSVVAPFTPSILSVKDQVGQWLNGAAKKPTSAPWTSANALFSVYIGINDIANTYSQSGDRNAFNDRLLDAYFVQIQRLYDNGARNFMFVTCPPVDRAPTMLGQSASAQAKEKGVIVDYNTKLASRVAALKTSKGDVQTWIYDSYAHFTTILNSPTTYGFQDATSVGTGSNRFWGDVIHPTSAAHKLLGQYVGQTVLAGTIW